MKFLVFVGCIILSFISCSGEGNTTVAPADSAVAPDSGSVVSKLHVDTVFIQFEDGFECYLVGLQRGMNPENPIETVHLKSASDTFVYELELGHNVDDAQLCFTTKALQNFPLKEVNERRTMVLSIQDEGPHYDLYDWHPYEEPFAAMQKLDATTYKPRITDYENLPFGKVNYSELKKHLNSQEGIEDSWIALLDSVDVKKRNASLVDYPLHVGVGLRWVQLKYGKGRVKVIKFIVPQGC